jgi:hypothetical protein
MDKLRVLILACITLLAAACSSTPTSTPASPASPAAKAEGPDLSGHWVLTIESQMGANDSDMTVQQTGEQLAGTITGQAGSVPYTGTVQGTSVAFSFTISIQGTELKIDQVGTIEGDTMKGKSVFGQFGEGTFTAKRKGS